MTTSNLFNDDETYTDVGLELAGEVNRTLNPLIVKWCAKHKTRDVDAVIREELNLMILEEMLDTT